MTITIIPDRDHGSVTAQPDGVPIPRGYGYDVFPVFDIALAIAIQSCCDHGSITAQSQSEPTSCGYSHDVLPVTNVAIRLCCDDRSITAQPHSVIPSCRYGYNVAPAGDTAALIVGVAPYSNHGPITAQSHSVPQSCCHSDNVFPVANITLAVAVFSCGDNRSVIAKSYSMVASGGQCCLSTGRDVEGSPLCKQCRPQMPIIEPGLIHEVGIVFYVGKIEAAQIQIGQAVTAEEHGVHCGHAGCIEA